MKFWLLSVFLVSSFLLIFINPAYALSIEDIASWVSNFFRVTGYQVYETTTTTTETTATATEQTISTSTTSLIKEQVKCLFTDSDAVQQCYAADGKFGCSGVGSCIADVAGESGTILVWKSTCPDVGYIETTVDGSSKYVAFKCMIPQPTAQTATQTVTATTPAEI